MADRVARTPDSRNGADPEQLGAERSLASVENAEAWLARHADPEFILELRVQWSTRDAHPPPEPPPIRRVEQIRRRADALVRALASVNLSREAHAVRRALQPFHGTSTRAWDRRMTTEPKRTRFAMVLAATAYHWCRDSGYRHLDGATDMPCAGHRVSGRLAAVLAVAEGVEIADKPWSDLVDRWKKRMVRARGTAARLWGDCD